MSQLLKIVSSQYKHLPHRHEDFIAPREISGGSMLKNEPYSFQVLYKAPDGNLCVPVSISAETSLQAEAFRVDCVSVIHPVPSESGREYESTAPGLFPDILMPRPASPEIRPAKTAWSRDTYLEKDTENLLNATSGYYQSVWFTINPLSKTIKAGEYKIRLTMTSLNTNTLLDEAEFTLNVINAALPKQDFYYTNWFHVDCVCDAFGVKPYSNAFYKIFDRYISNMTKHRQNTLLLPAFTPALDTAIGEERMNVQLVEVKKGENGWEFGFEKMRRFVRHSLKHGITVFEHCHLFSQWGAKNAPNVYDADGNRIFGFDTDASGKEYTEFIRAYLVAFFKFAVEEKIENSLIFHLSDEPKAEQLDSYKAAHDTVADLLMGSPVCDAMFDCSFYEAGVVDQPILHISHTDRYDKAKCPGIWVYYTGGGKDTTNRKISNTAAATRVLGLHMYKFEALGFLQWAYNFYYDRLSFGYCDPKINPCAYKMFPGITYLCYPVVSKGKSDVVPSIREKLMCEAMDDLRALKLLESKIGRESTLALCEEMLGEITPTNIPTGETLRKLREIINAKIAEFI